MQKTKTLAKETVAFLKRTILSLRFWKAVLISVLRFSYLLVFRPKALFPSVSPSLRLKLSISIASIIVLASSPFIYNYWKIQEAKPNYDISKNYFGGDYEYQTKNKDFQVGFVDKKDQGKPWVDFSTGDDSVRMALEEVQSAKCKVQSFSDAENGGKNKDRLVFADVQPETDLTYDIIDQGVKEEIVLKNEKALKEDNAYTFTIEGRNVEPVKVAEGVYSPAFIDKSSKDYAFHFLRPIMTDAAGAESDEITLQIKAKDNDGNYQVLLKPSSEWLKSKDRKFPIKIDPSIVHDESSDFTGTKNRTEDAGSTPYGGNDSFTKLLLHADGTNNSTTFTDSEETPKTVTANGDAKISTTQSKFGGSSAYFDGTGDYLSVPDSDDFNFGSGDFTVDFWMNPASSSDWRGIVWQGEAAGNMSMFSLEQATSGGVRWLIRNTSSTVIDITSSAISANSWTHVAAVRSGSNFNLYINGTSSVSATSAVALENYPYNMVVGKRDAAGQGTYYYSGYLDELRISKGVARWTSAFTPPALPYDSTISGTNPKIQIKNPQGGNDNNTKLLIQPTSGNITDTSVGGRGRAITNNGNVPTVASHPYATGAGYFNGSSYIESTSNDWKTRTSDFKYEFWFKGNGLGLFSTQWYYNSVFYGYAINANSRLSYNFYDGTSTVNLSGVTTTNDGRWHYAVVSRQGNVFSMYLDGNREATSTVPGVDVNLNVMTNARIGTYRTDDASAGFYTGYVSDFRLSVGTGVSGTTVPVPIAPLQADSYTRFLLPMNNPGSTSFIDASGTGKSITNPGNLTQQYLPPAGNAMSFNGSSQYLSVADSNDWNFGSGDFTIDTWAYPTSNTGNHVVVMKGATATFVPWEIVQVGTAYQFYASSSGSSWDISNGQSLGSVDLNAWTHLTVVRNGNSFYLFKNGIRVTAFSSSAVLMTNSSAVSIGGISGSSYFTGQLANVRVSKGIARWTSNFALPTKPYDTPKDYGVYTSPVVDGGSSQSWSTISWTENGVATGDGETPYSSASLVSQWNFNSTSGTTATSDAGTCGSSCNGTLTNMTTTGQDAATNSGWTANNRRWGAGALMFDGTDDYVSVPDSSNWDFGSGDFTVDFWANFSQKGGNGHGLILQRGSTSDLAWQVLYREDDSTLNFYYSTDGTSGTWTNKSRSWVPSWGSWNYIAVVRSGNALKFFVNGAQLGGTDYFNATIFNSSSPLRIGYDNYNTLWAFKGSMDAPRIYKGRAMTADEILANYQAGNVEMQTRTGSSSNPNDGTWEAWKPAGSGSETQMLSMDSDTNNWENKNDPYTKLQITPKSSNIIDESPSAKTITNNNGVTVVDSAGVPGGKALQFNKAASRFLSTGASSDLSLGKTWTVDFWAKGAVNGSQWFVNIGDGFSANGLEIASNATANFLVMSDGYNNNPIAGTRTVLDSTWHHVAVVADGTNVTLYVDGIYDGSRAAWDVNQQSGGTHIGCYWGSSTPTHYVDGQMADLRISKGIARWTSNFTPPTNSYDTPGQLTANNGNLEDNTQDTKLILHADGTNNSTTFTDTSAFNHQMTASGDAKVSTTQSKFGGSSAYFDGTGDYISVPDSDDWNFGTGNWTIDLWAKPTVLGGVQRSLFRTGTTENDAIDIGINTSNYWRFSVGTGSTYYSAASDVLADTSSWTHLTVLRDGGTVEGYVNGVLKFSSSGIGSNSVANPSEPVNIGRRQDGTQYYVGYIDEVRVTKGTARWTSNFTPPALPASDKSNNNNPVISEGSGSMKVTTGAPQCDGNTTALWHLDETGGSGAYVKDVCGGHDGTPTGTSSVNGFAGKARSFNGTSDYVSVPNSSDFNFGNGDFTIDTWYRTPSAYTGGQPMIASTMDSSVATQGWALMHYQASGQLYFTWGTGGTYYQLHSAWTPSLQTWYHIAVARVGSTVTIYVNGAYFTSAGISAAITDSAFPLLIGKDNSNLSQYFLAGSIDELRISKGYGRSANEIAETYRAGRDWRLGRTVSSTDLSAKSKLPFYVAADRPGTYMDATVGESNFANYESDSNTVGLWHLDEAAGTIKDSSSYGNNVSAITGTAYVSGKMGGARNFNGSSDYLNIPDSDKWTIGANPYSISAWVRLNSLPGAGTVYAIATQSDSQHYYNFTISTSGLAFGGNYGGGSNGISQGDLSGWDTGKWHFVSFVSDGTNFYLYKDGSLIKQAARTDNFTDLTGPLQFGCQQYVGQSARYFMDGSIDEIRIDNTVRSASDIHQAYEVGKRTHSITIDFAASLDSANLITDSSDTSFTINSQTYGNPNKGDNLYAGDKVIVKENWNGTEYIAQGTVTNVNQSTGAVTVNSWDANSAFPSGGQTGFSANATVFKWQREWMDLTGIMTDQRNAATRLTLRMTDGSEGRNIYLDDFEDANYLTNPATTGNIQSSAGRYLQYRTILTTNDNSSASNLTPSISQVSLDSQDPIPVAPTNVQATDGTYTDKVTISWTKSSSATGYRVYRDGVQIGTDLGDVATYDDTAANPPSITAGTVSASEGSSPTQVNLALTGQSANDGTHHTYKVVAFNSNGASPDSSTDTGYRGAGALTVQWQVSAADSDADYSDIPGATTASYTYTDAPAGPVGRYYRAVLNATGASQAITDAERGNMAGGAIELKPGTSFKRDVEFR